MKKINIIFLLIFLFVVSCVPRKDVVYFENISELKDDFKIINNNVPIKVDDRITIRINSQEQSAANPFNKTNFLGNSETNITSNIELVSYQVDEDGTIEMPFLGDVHVSGLSVIELRNKINDLLKPYLPDAIITVRLDNFQISVLGEVRDPGTFTVLDDHITIIKALGLAKDITATGEKRNVLVVRRNGNNIQSGYLDLTDTTSLKSPYYNLQQNDVVYVEPRSARRQAAGYFSNAPTYISLASVITSIIVLLTR